MHKYSTESTEDMSNEQHLSLFYDFYNQTFLLFSANYSHGRHRVTYICTCLCVSVLTDDEEYHKLVKEILPKDIPINEKFGIASPDPNASMDSEAAPAVVSDLLLPFVVILLGHGVQLVFHSGLL